MTIKVCPHCGKRINKGDMVEYYKCRILEEIKKGNNRWPLLLKSIDLSKATLLDYLNQLKKEGMVELKPDPLDRRRKIYVVVKNIEG